MKNISSVFFSIEFLKFVFAGGAGTLTNFLCSLYISRYINPTVSYIAGYVLSLSVTYTLNAKLIFKRAVNRMEFLKFIVSYIPNFLILFGFVAVFLNILKWNKIIVYALAGTLGLPLTFVLVKVFAFGKRKYEGEIK